MIADTVIVTGSEGYIGRQFVDMLKTSSVDVVPIDIENDDDPINIRDTMSLIEVFDSIDGDAVCIHLAAEADVNANTDDAFETNVEGTDNLATLCGDFDVPMINISSVAAKYPQSHAYAASKSIQEGILYTLDVDAITVRLPNVVGPGHEKGNVRSMIEDGVDGGPIEAWYDGRGVRTYVSRESVCNILFAMCECESFDVVRNEFGEYSMAENVWEIQGIDMMTYTVANIVSEAFDMSMSWTTQRAVECVEKEAGSPRVLTTSGIPSQEYENDPYESILEQTFETFEDY